MTAEEIGGHNTDCLRSDGEMKEIATRKIEEEMKEIAGRKDVQRR